MNEGERMFKWDVIRELREELGMTQHEFARATGVVQSTVHRWENRIVAPTVDHLARMFELGCENGYVCYFFSGLKK